MNFPHINSTHKGTLATTAQPIFQLGRYLRLTTLISAETIPAKPMIPIQHFEVDDF